MNTKGLLDSSSVRTSDIKGFFRNNITSSDRHVISQFLLDAEQEMKGYDAEINRLQTAIHLLETKKLGLKKSMDRCRSLLSPVHRLPMEILMEIFSIACEENELYSSILPNAMNLSSVCGRWWEVIRSAPKLWSSITIRFSDWKRRFPVLEDLVSLYLDRAATQPLHLQLDFIVMGQGGSETFSILRLLHDHAARWQVLDLSEPPSVFPCTPSPHGFPALQVVRLRYVRSTLPDPLFSLFRNATSLHTFDVTGNLELSGESKFDIPFHQIKTLFVRHTFVCPALARYLAKFSALETLNTNGIGFPYDVQQEDTEPYLSKTITSVAFEFDSQIASDTTFRLFTFPRLTSLQVWGSRESLYEWPSWESGAVTDFLSRSSSITSLSLKNLPITGDQTIALLERIPTLASLQVVERERTGEDPETGPLPNRIVTQPFLQRLTVDRDVFRPSRPFLPLLTDVTIAMRENDAEEQGLFSAIASRWIPDLAEAKEIGVKSLKSITITLLEREGDSEERRLLKSLKCFRDAGLRLRLDR
ncbi:hypothetical protein PQX77_017266 [Marasmius sp. AFHP31]|nr:hypothetical protein PQX77_017266 [Marasmius sp. AFHP31]